MARTHGDRQHRRARARRRSVGLVGDAADVQAIAEELHAVGAEIRAQTRPGHPRRVATTSTTVPDERLQRSGRIDREQVAFVSSATRLHRSASSRYGVAMTIVRPCAQEFGKQLPELTARHRVDTGRRLVEHEQRRLVDERAGERELLLHAAGQSFGQPAAKRLQPGQPEQPLPRDRRNRARRAGARRTRCSRRSTDPRTD